MEDLVAKGFPLMPNPRRLAVEDTAVQSIADVAQDLANSCITMLCWGHSGAAPTAMGPGLRHMLVTNVKVLRLIEEGRERPGVVEPLLRQGISDCLASYEESRAIEHEERARRGGVAPMPIVWAEERAYFERYKRYCSPFLEFKREHEYMLMAFYVLANLQELGPPGLIRDWLQLAKTTGCEDMEIWLVDCYFGQPSLAGEGHAKVHFSLLDGTPVSGAKVKQSKWDAPWDVHDGLLVARQVDTSDIPTIEVLDVPAELSLGEETGARVLANFLDHCHELGLAE
jgi:hypothetical protein